MLDFPSSFIIGFLYTASLFFLCFFLVLGIKSVYLALKKYLGEKLYKQLAPPPTPEPIKKAVRKRKSASKPIRSIEIDPDKIDRIYVKKIS